MASDVFVSYSRKDEAFVKQLYQELIGRGISTWYDRENIGVGSISGLGSFNKRA